jgi:hypothetical protein
MKMVINIYIDTPVIQEFLREWNHAWAEIINQSKLLSMKSVFRHSH